MCIKEETYVTDASGRQYIRETFVQRCSPPCPTPRIIRPGNNPFNNPPGMMGQFMGGGQPAQVIYPREEAVLIQPKKKPKDLELRWTWHIPGTSKEPKSKAKKAYIVPVGPPPMHANVIYPAQQAFQPNYMQHPLPTPPVTPLGEPVIVRLQGEPIIETIAPRTPVREHVRPPVAPTVPRESSRERRARHRERENQRQRERERSRERREIERQLAIRRQAEERARLQTRINELAARQRALQIAREEAWRNRDREPRIRAIEDELAAVRDELDRADRRLRAAEGPVIHQEHRPRRQSFAEDEIREHHRPGFHQARRDSGGGGGIDFEHGLDGRRAREREREREIDREIRNLERQLDAQDRGRRRRRSTLPHNVDLGGPFGGFQGGNPFRRDRSVPHVRIDIRNRARRV